MSRCRTCGGVDRPSFKGSDRCLTCQCGEPSTIVHVPTERHRCDLVQSPFAPLPSSETWAPAGTIQRCNVCGCIWLAEPPIQAPRGQQSCANRWVLISWRRARLIMKRAGRG